MKLNDCTRFLVSDEERKMLAEITRQETAIPVFPQRCAG